MMSCENVRCCPLSKCLWHPHMTASQLAALLSLNMDSQRWSLWLATRVPSCDQVSEPFTDSATTCSLSGIVRLHRLLSDYLCMSHLGPLRTRITFSFCIAACS